MEACHEKESCTRCDTSREKIVIVDQQGNIQRMVTKKEEGKEDIIAVELVLMYIREERKIVLFNRGTGASDMHSHWALQSGKVNGGDLTAVDLVGRELSIGAYRKAAIREISEELSFEVAPERLEYAAQFLMSKEGKNRYFTLFTLSLTRAEARALSPDLEEIDRYRLFSMEEFDRTRQLGDAIRYKKDFIMENIKNKFGH